MARSRDAAACACCRAEPHAGQRLGERGELVVAHPPLAQCGQGPRVALPGDHRLDDRAGGLVPGQLRHDGRQLAQGVLQQLLQPLPVPRAVRGQVPDVPGIDPQRPDLRRRHERGPQHPHLGQPRDPPRVLLVGLRPARQVPGLGGVHQLHRQPGLLQHHEPDAPVVARWPPSTPSAPLPPSAPPRAPRSPGPSPAPSAGATSGASSPPPGASGRTPPRTPSPRRSPRRSHSAAGSPRPPPPARSSASASASARPPRLLILDLG